MEYWSDGEMGFWSVEILANECTRVEYMNAAARPLGRAQGVVMFNCQLYNKQSVTTRVAWDLSHDSLKRF